MATYIWPDSVDTAIPNGGGVGGLVPAKWLVVSSPMETFC